MKVFKTILIIIQFKSLSAILMTRSSFISTANNYLSSNILNNAYYGDEPEIKPDTESVSKPEKVEISFEKDNQNPLTINFYTPVSTESCMVLAAMLK